MASLQFFNTLSKKVEDFVPIEEGKVKMYICGPTVYDSPHIGHARTYISFDIIRRLLSEYFGYEVLFVMNITDIDDKIIRRAAEQSVTCEELTERYENEFFSAMDRLNVVRPDFVTRVTQYIKENVEFVERLEENGLAYAVNGSVYFDLKKYKECFKYNLLRPAVHHGDEDEDASSEKKSRGDFALWKASKPDELHFETRWGPMGRPGWHIECSAMSSAVFGKKLDIHAGGIDLAFPHHENEIAQCQGCFGDKWVNYFMHTGHLNISGRKMSKSLKNFLTIDEIISTSSPLALRMLFLRHLWSKDMDYDPEQLKEAEAILKRLLNFVSVATSRASRIDKRAINDVDRRYLRIVEEKRTAVRSAFSLNFNVPKAIDELIQLVQIFNEGMKGIHTDVLRIACDFVRHILRLLGLYEKEEGASECGGVAELLNTFRSEVRRAAKEKSGPALLFKLCDEARDRIKEFGYTIDDCADGSIVRRINL